MTSSNDHDFLEGDLGNMFFMNEKYFFSEDFTVAISESDLKKIIFSIREKSKFNPKTAQEIVEIILSHTQETAKFSPETAQEITEFILAQETSQLSPVHDKKIFPVKSTTKIKFRLNKIQAK